MRWWLIGSACLVASACYAPELRDCTVTCSGSSASCAADQVCGSDGFCAAPEVAGRCEDLGVPPMVALRVLVYGDGRVAVKEVGECRSHEDADGDCTWLLAPGTAIELAATRGEFEQWTSACSGAQLSCTLAPASATIVGARFRPWDD